jgi:hypothetical protein
MACIPEALDEIIDILDVGQIDIGKVGNGERLHPLDHCGPAALIEQRLRIGFVDGVREEQRHQVGEARYAIDPGIVGALLEERDLLDARFEQLLCGGEP